MASYWFIQGKVCVVLEMVRAAGQAGFDMISVNQIIVETVFPANWELTTIVKGESDTLERRNYRWLKLTDQILKIAERITEELIRQEADVEKCLS